MSGGVLERRWRYLARDWAYDIVIADEVDRDLRNLHVP